MAVGNYEIVSEDAVASSAIIDHTIYAPEGKVIIGVGFSPVGDVVMDPVYECKPTDGGTSWHIYASVGGSASPLKMTIFAICAEMC